MEVNTKHSAATLMEANVYQEDQVLKPREAEEHETQLKQVLENTYHTKGDIHNGEY